MNDTQGASLVVWKTLTIGTVGSVPKYRQALESGNFHLSKRASDILKKMPVATEAQELDIVVISIAELGFTDWTRYDDICRRAKERGYERCPAEVGPALRLAYTNQPMGAWLVVAMEPMAGSDGSLDVFHVGRYGGGSWLGTDDGDPDSRWGPGGAFVFVQRKP